MLGTSCSQCVPNWKTSAALRQPPAQQSLVRVGDSVSLAGTRLCLLKLMGNQLDDFCCFDTASVYREKETTKETVWGNLTFSFQKGKHTQVLTHTQIHKHGNSHTIQFLVGASGREFMPKALNHTRLRCVCVCVLY